MSAEENLKRINKEIQLTCERAQRAIDAVTLIAVTKSVDSDRAQELVECGVTHLAENRVDKLLPKKQDLVAFPNVNWHLIGNLQRKKVKLIINEIDYFHALDSLRLAEEIQKRATKVIRCFVEVNISGEASKHGFAQEEVSPFIQQLSQLDKIQVVGLMTMAPLHADEAELHATFKQLKDLQTAIMNEKLAYAPCTELSMGMSNDFTIAVEEGATFVRIGTALFRNT